MRGRSREKRLWSVELLADEIGLEGAECAGRDSRGRSPEEWVGNEKIRRGQRPRGRQLEAPTTTRVSVQMGFRRPCSGVLALDPLPSGDRILCAVPGLPWCRDFPTSPRGTSEGEIRTRPGSRIVHEKSGVKVKALARGLSTETSKSERDVPAHTQNISSHVKKNLARLL